MKRKLFLLLALIIGSLGAWAQFTWKNSSTAITTESWASADSWTLTGSTTFPTAGSGPMTTNSNAWALVNITNASGTVADLEGWVPKMILDNATLTIGNIRKLQGDGKYFNLKNGSTLTLTLGASNSGNDGGTVPVTFEGNGNTFNFKLARAKDGDATTVNYGVVTDETTNKFNLLSNVSGTARTFNSLRFAATIEGESTSSEIILHSVVLGNISSDITVNTLTYEISAENFEKTEGVLAASYDNIGKYSVVKGNNGDVTLYWVTGSSILAQAFAGTKDINSETLTVNPNNSTLYSNSSDDIIIANANGLSTFPTSGETNRPQTTVSFRINLAAPTSFNNIFTFSTDASWTTDGNIGIGLSNALNLEGLWKGGEWNTLKTGTLSEGFHIITVTIGDPGNSYGTCIYVDGNSQHEIATGLKTKDNTYKNFLIDAAIARKIDALYIYNRVLTTDEIASVVSEISTIPEPEETNGEVQTIVGTGTKCSNGGCGVKWIGFNIPAKDINGKRIHKTGLKNIQLLQERGNDGNQSYMVVSNSTTLTNESIKAVSVNNPALPSNNNAIFLTYNFSNETIEPGKYYLFFVSDRTAPTTNQANRIALSSTSETYAPRLMASNGNTQSNWTPNIKFNAIPTFDDIFSTEFGQKWVSINFVRDAGYSWKISGTSEGATPSNLADEDIIGNDRQWCLVGSPTSFKIYSRAAGNGLALTTDATNIGNGTTVSLTNATNACSWTLISSGAGYEITREGETAKTLNSYGGKGKQIKYYDKGDNGAVWSFNLPNTLTIKHTIPGVDRTYTWNGQTKTGSTVTFSSTSFVQKGTITVSAVPGYISSLSESEWNGKSTKTIINNLTPNFFTTEADFTAQNENVKWVRVDFAKADAKGNSWGLVDNTPKNIASNVADQSQLWCFVGDKSNFKIYNKAAGTAKAMTTDSETIGNGTTTSMVDAAEACSWALGESYLNAEASAGYTIARVGESSTGMALNSYGANTNAPLKYWNASGTGSHWTITEVGGELTITVNVAGEKIYPINSKVGSLAVTFNGQTQTTRLNLGDLTEAGTITTVKIRAPKGAAITIAEGSPKFAGYDFSGVTYGGNTNTTATIDDIPIDGAQATVTFTANNYQNIFYTYEDEYPFRIPAIVKTQNGNLIAASDYRYCRGDVGNGRVDIVTRTSRDNGTTWESTVTRAQGWRNESEKPASASSDQSPYGYGDATLVADNESGAVLLGYCGAPSGATCWTDKPDYLFQQSFDNGETWEANYSVMADIKAKIRTTGYAMTNFFVGSGKIVQSRYYKKEGATYKRIFCVLWGYDGSIRTNWVVYSDDFGKTWDILGNTYAAMGDCDEPKCEELPDGNIVLSSRDYGCRWFNIFTYSDKANGTGTWQTAVKSNSVSGGLSFGGNGTNGEILVLKAIKASDKSIHNLVFQSVPTGGSRSNVAIYMKNLDDATSYSTPSNFSTGWTQVKMVAPYSSCYSTMCIQADGKIAFFYEDGKSGAGYDMVYVPYTIAELTNNEYESIVMDVYKDEASTETDIVVKGDIISADQLAEVVDETASSVDMTQASVDAEISDEFVETIVAKTKNKNTLVYVPASANVSAAKNVIVKNGSEYTCQSLVLTDKMPFSAPNEFTASNAVYTRTMANKWGTICLPYAVTSNENEAYYTIDRIEDGKLIINQVEGLEAGQPGLVQKFAGDGIAPAATSVEVVGSKNDETLVDGTVTMIGSFANDTKVTDENAFYIKDNKFWQRAEASEQIADPCFYIDAFRAYFKVEPAANQSRIMSIVVNGDEATGIDALEIAEALSGKEGKFLQNGRVVIVKDNRQYTTAGQRLK